MKRRNPLASPDIDEAFWEMVEVAKRERRTQLVILSANSGTCFYAKAGAPREKKK